MLYSVELNALPTPGKAAIVAIVDECPSRVTVALRGSFDCTTTTLIPDPNPLTGEQRCGSQKKNADL
jgi:hypothetical protein